MRANTQTNVWPHKPPSQKPKAAMTNKLADATAIIISAVDLIDEANYYYGLETDNLLRITYESKPGAVDRLNKALAEIAKSWKGKR